MAISSRPTPLADELRARGAEAAGARCEILGGHALHGTLAVEGCKLSSVPMIAAAALTREPLTLVNLPRMLDQRVMLACLEDLGADVAMAAHETRIDCASLSRAAAAPSDLVRMVHGTLYLLPALLVRNGSVRISADFGGCRIGHRPVHHIFATLELFGARIAESASEIVATWTQGGPRGAVVDLLAAYGTHNNKFISGATKTALIAAVLARGETLIRGAWWGKPITAFCRFLTAMGADIAQVGRREIGVRGRPALTGTRFHVPHDHLALGTYIGAVGITGGAAFFPGADLSGLDAEGAAFRQMGVRLAERADGVEVSAQRLQGIRLSTDEISTDLGPVFAALMTAADGDSALDEVIWEHRFGYADELWKLGARSTVDGSTLYIQGGRPLTGGDVAATDVRGAAALVLAGLSAHGATRVFGVHHLDRGYQDLVASLARLEGRVQRVGRQP